MAEHPEYWIPHVFGYHVEGWQNSWPAGTPQEEKDKWSRWRKVVKAGTDMLAFRGIHAEDYVIACAGWEPIEGEVVLVEKSTATHAGAIWQLGIYRRDERGDFLETDGPGMYRGYVLSRGPYRAVWPVAEVQHSEHYPGQCCLYRYPPEHFQPWWEARDEDRTRAEAIPPRPTVAVTDDAVAYRDVHSGCAVVVDPAMLPVSGVVVLALVADAQG